MPQIPTPTKSSFAMVASSIMVIAKEIVNPMIHPSGVFFIRTIELILSVMLAKLYPG